MMADYRKRAKLFGDGANGKRLQVWSVLDGDTLTGIEITAVKPHHNAPWEQTVTFGDQEYPSVKDAIAAYEAAGKEGADQSTQTDSRAGNR
jgi:hypothetical protein